MSNISIKQAIDSFLLSYKMEVASIDPIASMAADNNPRLRSVGEEVRVTPKAVIDNL
jgi:hypothetical protein